MDGAGFLAAHASDPLLVHVPVVVVSAERVETVPSSVRAIFTKPVRVEHLLVTLEQLAQRPERARADPRRRRRRSRLTALADRPF